MPDRIAVIAPGAMGSAIAAVLTGHGAHVLTLLDGRSASSRERAANAGMRGVDAAELVQSGLILSIVPPGEALGLAQRLAVPLASAADKPIVVDCNALDVRTVRAVGEVVTASGAGFVDGGIIGGPPKPGAKGPTLYLSGDAAAQVEATLGRFGLNARAIEGGIGAASALKMSYAGITKGLTAIASVMVLGAVRAGAADALIAELRESQPQLAARFANGLPDMLPKAYRWVAEMREIAAFLDRDPAGAAIFESAAELYERLSDQTGAEAETLRDFANRISAKEPSPSGRGPG
jgi:3-hydroxyisobutyrate dehydrogenase-like beta-hydroxyacid dehydrogenase